MSGQKKRDWAHSRKRKNSEGEKVDDNEALGTDSRSDDADNDRDQEGGAEVFGLAASRTRQQRTTNNNALKTKHWREKQKMLQEKRKADIKRLQEENVRLSRENSELRHALALMEARLRELSMQGGVLVSRMNCRF